ncbi:hypothetical protein RB2501_07130 [Robiginitalea biformata HTCC2501]|uniref:Uncharacterized protein n=1 Tax=Robiginitalea biformata (strain ATCC BAA-864 / DSM 15991 / KCTC 12146 / HTCC2501) TaxID=313596 RepID=A4CI96_ROBBH|nr:hypothetical protein RB2501_07130 [Robiginitalea biformata HTCC2501]
MITCLDALEQGYLIFPYIIWRRDEFDYVQIPIHRDELCDLFEEGLFIPKSLERDYGFHKAILELFGDIWIRAKRKKSPKDMYLVFSPEACWHLSSECPVTKGRSPEFTSLIPKGGHLYALSGDLLRINQPHYVI